MKHNNRSIRISIFVLLVLFQAIPSLAQKSSKNTDKYLISAETFKSVIEKKSNIIILDVRTPEEFDESHIKGSINVDYKNENFRNEISELDKSKKFYIYCRSGKRSANSRLIMNDMGFKKVYDLNGGILAWKELNYPTE